MQSATKKACWWGVKGVVTGGRGTKAGEGDEEREEEVDDLEWVEVRDFSESVRVLGAEVCVGEADEGAAGGKAERIGFR